MHARRRDGTIIRPLRLVLDEFDSNRARASCSRSRTPAGRCAGFWTPVAAPAGVGAHSHKSVPYSTVRLAMMYASSMMHARQSAVYGLSGCWRRRACLLQSLTRVSPGCLRLLGLWLSRDCCHCCRFPFALGRTARRTAGRAARRRRG